MLNYVYKGVKVAHIAVFEGENTGGVVREGARLGRGVDGWNTYCEVLSQ